MQSFVTVASALGDPSRARVLMALRHGELCVCQITELLRLAPSTVSKHLATLKQAGLVESRKEGRWIHYRLSGKDAAAEVRDALRWVRARLIHDEAIQRDDMTLRSILACDREELCRRQSRS